MKIVGLRVEPLSVPLLEPFVIATGRMDATRAVLVRATVEDETGRQAEGLGEAAALPPVTREDQPDLLAELGAIAPRALADLDRLGPVARAGAEAAVLDAHARLQGTPLYRLLDPDAPPPAPLETDMTLPIVAPAHMARLAAGHRARGFITFKVKVGKDRATDLAALRAVRAAVPDARFRLDANAGFGPADALALLDAALGDGLVIECFEQPARDLDGLAEVTARSPVPVVADESFRGADDLDRLIDARAAHGVNLKLAKLGGPRAALALGRRARAAGLKLMAGAMVETRVGLTTMAHVVWALGGVDWVDLDTAFLLRDDPFRGGYSVDRMRLLPDGPVYSR